MEEAPTAARKRMRGSKERKEKAPRRPQVEDRLRRTFSSASSLLGPNDKEEDLQQHRQRLLCKAKQLSFPTYPTGFYKKASVGKQYGRDASHGGVLGLGAYHKSILNTLLDEFMLTHQWRESAAVLSVLLRGLLTERSWNIDYYHQFWATMEVMRQLEGLQGNESKFNKVYQILYDQQPKDLLTRDKTYAGAVRLEQALYLMGQKHFEEAQFASRPFMDTPSYRDNAVANMIHGHINYYWWLDLVKQEVAQSLSRGANAPIKVELGEGMGENTGLTRSSDMCWAPFIKEELVFMSDNNDLILEDLSVLDVHSSQKCVMSHIEERHEENFQDEDKKEQIQKLYDDADVDESIEKSYFKKARIIVNAGMDKRLFPISLPDALQGSLYVVPMSTVRVKGCHSTAIKHLHKALSLDRQVLMVLVPLVQLMLAVGDVEGAYEEINKCCQGSQNVLPFRMKTMLLKSLTPKNRDLLLRSYEETLERDPTSTDSIEGLIALHNNGEYKLEHLFESIACHLDGCLGALSIWRSLLSCFEKLRKSEIDLQRCDTAVVVPQLEAELSTSSRILEFLTEKAVQEAWKIRAKWWPQKHFESKSIDHELCLSGGLNRLVYKAACAAHIFGSTVYVLEVESKLQISGSHQHATKLRMHRENSFGLVVRLSST